VKQRFDPKYSFLWGVPTSDIAVKTPKKQSTDSLGSRASDDKTTPGFLGQPSYEGVVERGVVLGGLHDVTKSFGAIVAIQGVSFELRSGEVLALLGENGAGKSTCVKVLAGVHSPTAGHVYLQGQPVHLRSPLDAQHRGIAVMHQHPGLFGDLSIAENVFMGHPKKGFLGILDHDQILEETHRLLEIVGLQADRGLSGL
jgi:rhamnose transport system ATP-binding protein